MGEIEVAFLQRQKLKGKENIQRETLIALINQFLAKYPDSKEVPDQLFRLAELAYEDSKEIYFSSQEKFEKDYELFLAGKISEEPVEPKPDYHESITVAEKLFEGFPDYDRRDQVLYVLGYYYEEQGLRQKSIASFL